MGSHNGPQIKEVKCPFCSSGAVYKYGKIKSGKQRFYCIICGRQFTHNARRILCDFRPTCRKCGTMMHIYKREKDFTRFRCAHYPQCKTYIKILIKKEPMNELLSA
jgi:hypothetical protein